MNTRFRSIIYAALIIMMIALSGCGISRLENNQADEESFEESTDSTQELNTGQVEMDSATDSDYGEEMAASETIVGDNLDNSANSGAEDNPDDLGSMANSGAEDDPDNLDISDNQDNHANPDNSDNPDNSPIVAVEITPYDDALTVDDAVISRYLNLPQEELDKAPLLEDYSDSDVNNGDLYLVKLAEYKDEGIVVYGLNEGVIISYKGKKDFFQCGWRDMYPTHEIGLCDIDNDGVKELILTVNSLRANTFTFTNRDIMRAFRFSDEGITVFKLPEIEVPKMLDGIFEYDADNKSILIRQGGEVAADIPLSAYEEEYKDLEKTEPLETVVEYMNYVSGWQYVITEDEVLLRVHVCVGGKMLDLDIYPKDGDGEEIVPAFRVILRDGMLDLVYKP